LRTDFEEDLDFFVNDPLRGKLPPFREGCQPRSGPLPLSAKTVSADHVQAALPEDS
jgi:hypothetical protein